MWDFRTTAAMHHTVFFGLHEGILRWQKRRSKRHRMPECNSPLGWQTSFQRIPVHYHSMPSHSDDALYRCSTDSKVHWFPQLRSHYCWHPPRFAGIFDETPKVKASQLQKKSLAAFIFLLYHLRWQSFFMKSFSASVFLQFWECDTFLKWILRLGSWCAQCFKWLKKVS